MRVRSWVPFASLFLLAPAAGCGSDVETPPAGEAGPAPAVCAPDAFTAGPALPRIDSLLEARREADRVPGLAAAVVCRDRLVWSEGHGVVALDDPRPVTPETRFRIASLTKVFTATAVVQLADRGALDLDDRVAAHLRWFRLAPGPEGDGSESTVRHLLTHTGGMPRDSRLTDFARLYQPPRADAIEALPAQSLRSRPGEEYAYSNLGYAVLGEVIAAASGATYREYLDRETLDPLGMTEALVHPAPDDDTAWGHGPRRDDGARAKAGFWELAFATPAGGMAASVAELGPFVRLHLAPYLAPYRDEEPSLLSADAIREMHRVHHEIDPVRGGSGLGWAVETGSGQHLVYHGG